jgi:hypothetical protein
MVELQLLAGTRPGEAIMMPGCDIDTGTGGTVQIYRQSDARPHDRDGVPCAQGNVLFHTY